MPLSPWAAGGVGGIVEELERHRGRIEVQPQAVLVVAEIGPAGDRHHRHIPAVGVADAAGAGVKQEVGASPGADVAGLGQKPQDDTYCAAPGRGDPRRPSRLVRAPTLQACWWPYSRTRTHTETRSMLCSPRRSIAGRSKCGRWETCWGVGPTRTG